MSEQTAMLAVMQSFELTRIEGEARRICDERGWTSMDDLRKVADALRYEAFRDAIQPYIRIKCTVHSLTPLKRVTIGADGLGEEEYEYSPTALETLKLADEMIAGVAKRFGYDSETA